MAPPGTSTSLGTASADHPSAAERPQARAVDRRALGLVAVVAILTFGLAYDKGSFRTASWTLDAVVVWWAIVLVVAGGYAPRRLPRSVLVSLGALTAFAVLNGLSGFWGSEAETPFLTLDQTLFYAGVAILVVLTARRHLLARWTDGLAVGLSAVAFLALASRFFPSAFAPDTTSQFVPDALGRLSYPVGYWNGLAILVALACPLLVRAAIEPGSPVWTKLWLLPLPAIGTVIYLSSSRNGAATAVIGAGIFLAIAPRRWATVGALFVAGVAALAAVAYVASAHALVNGPLRSSAARSEGVRAALVVLASGVAAAAAYALLERAARRVRVPQWTGWVATALVGAIAVVAVIAAHPIRRWHEFISTPSVDASSIGSHFLSGNGNWRWQLWHSAVKEFETRPLAGRGSGSFEAWWTQHGLNVFSGNAHSLYFQTLGELGLVGMFLIVGAFAVALGTGTRAALRADARTRTAAAAAIGAFSAFAVSTGVDWTWQLPAVATVGAALLGLVLAATVPDAEPRPASGRTKTVAVACAVAFAIAVVLAEGDLYLGQARIAASQRAAAARDFAAARSDARSARWFEPWAASPYLQLALVEEAAGRLAQASRAVDTALARSPQDWRIRFIAARIEIKHGDVEKALADYQIARELNQRAPLLAGAG